MSRYLCVVFHVENGTESFSIDRNNRFIQEMTTNECKTIQTIKTIRIKTSYDKAAIILFMKLVQDRIKYDDISDILVLCDLMAISIHCKIYTITERLKEYISTFYTYKCT
mgnify:CR=1 FL=1